MPAFETVPVHCDSCQNCSKDKDNSEEDSNAGDAVDVGPHLLGRQEVFKQKIENKIKTELDFFTFSLED